MSEKGEPAMFQKEKIHKHQPAPLPSAPLLSATPLPDAWSMAPPPSHTLPLILWPPVPRPPVPRRPRPQRLRPREARPAGSILSLARKPARFDRVFWRRVVWHLASGSLTVRRGSLARPLSLQTASQPMGGSCSCPWLGQPADFAL